MLVLEEGRQLLLRLLQEGRLMLLEERHLLVCGQDGPRHRESSCAKDGRCGHLHQRCCKWSGSGVALANGDGAAKEETRYGDCVPHGIGYERAVEAPCSAVDDADIIAQCVGGREGTELRLLPAIRYGCIHHGIHILVGLQ